MASLDSTITIDATAAINEMKKVIEDFKALVERAERVNRRLKDHREASIMDESKVKTLYQGGSLRAACYEGQHFGQLKQPDGTWGENHDTRPCDCVSTETKEATSGTKTTERDLTGS